MSLQGEQLSAPAPIDDDIEQLLLGLADGSYLLSTPDGVVAECGIGAGAMLGASPEDLAGHPVPDILASAGDPAQRTAFEQLLHGRAHGSEQRFAAVCAHGSTRALRCLVVAFPLALGWDFTALLSELGSRDADSWQLDELRLRHERALEAVEAVCKTGAQPDTGGRLAGILVVIADSDAPPLTRQDVGERMERHREAVREAREAARRAELGLDEPGGGADVGGGDLEDLVESAQLLRARLEEAELEAEGARAERQQALDGLAAEQAERIAERGRTFAQVQALQSERQEALVRLDEEQAERERAIATLQAEQAERTQALARLAEVEAERDGEAQRRAVAESHTAMAQDGRLRELAGERDAAVSGTQAARAAAEEARAATDAARADSQRLTAELQELRASISTQQASSVSAHAELQARRAEVREAQAAAEAAREELRAARADAESARGIRRWLVARLPRCAGSSTARAAHSTPPAATWRSCATRRPRHPPSSMAHAPSCRPLARRSTRARASSLRRAPSWARTPAD